MEKCLKGEVIPKLEIEFTATYGGTQATYLRWIMEEVIISSFQTNASGNNEAGPPTVVIGNNFEEIKMTYTEYDRERKSKGNVEVEFRVENGK
jgi:type VI protein secretion system component Hcp